MKSDRTQRRPSIVLCAAAALLATAPASIVRAADRDDSVRMAGESDPAGRACNWASANPLSSICPRRRERSTSAIPTSPTRSCARRSGSTFPASPMAKRAFSRWPGTGEELRPSKSRSGAPSPSCRTCSTPPSPATKFMCARSRTRSSSPGQSHPPRRLKRRWILLTALSMIRRSSGAPGASISISNGSGGGPGRRWRRRRQILQQRSWKGDQRPDDPRRRPGQPARHGCGNSSRNHQAARRQLSGAGQTEASTSTIRSPSTALSPPPPRRL